MEREIKSGPRRGLTLVYTGNGKGKTTAALGLLFRALGRDFKVIMLQFIKNKKRKYGEHLMAERLGVEIRPLGDGFTWESANIEFDKNLANECWQECKTAILSNRYDMVILDEITYPMHYGWLEIEEVLATLRQRDPAMHVVLTGRKAPQQILDYADLVSEVQEIKHPLKKGIRAKTGIEM